VQIGHYRILDKLGAGGMGEVYRAHDEQLDRTVAIKLLPATSFDDPEARQRLVREARSAAALNHPHICTVYQVGEADGRTFIAMELVEGETLSARLDHGPLRPDQVVRYGLQLADALSHAHDRGIVHRDLKSANVVVTPEGRVKVLDFGLAKRLTTSDLTTQFDATVAKPGTIVGTLAYMAPEQLRAQPATAASDVWALGAVLYEMSQGARPFKGQTPFEVSAAILNDAPAPLSPSVPASLQAVIRKCLEKEPGERYKSGNDVRAALEVIQATSDFRAPVAAPPTEPVPVAGSRGARQPFVLRRGVLVPIAVAIAASLVFAIWRLSSPDVDVRTLAIVPLLNLENDEAIDYVAEGIADSLIRQTRRLPSMKVTSLRAVLSLKGKKVNVAEDGRALKVESIVTGTVKRQGSSLHITAQLDDVASGRLLWRKEYDRETAQLMDVQDEIATAIMNDGLKLRLSNADQRQLVRRPTENAEAYDLFLQAQHLQREPTEENYLNGAKLLDRAVQRDPKFAAAYASLSGMYAMLVTDGYQRPTDGWPKVRTNIGNARELDPGLVEINAFEHAYAFLFDWDWKAAERARERLLQSTAAEVDPQVLRAVALERLALGHPAEALAVARRMRELDPLSPDLAVIEADYLLQDGQLDAAVALYEKAFSQDSESANALFGLAKAKLRQKRFDDASAARRRAHELNGQDEIAKLFAAARGEDGYRRAERAWVEAQLAEVKRLAVIRYVSPLDFARLYAQLGQKGEAFRYIDEAFKDRSPGLVALNFDDAWDLIRHDPQFLEAVHRVPLPDPPARK
jgi:serine/threonine-protein kinase